jgi:hypothetical protein
MFCSNYSETNKSYHLSLRQIKFLKLLHYLVLCNRINFVLKNACFVRINYYRLCQDINLIKYQQRPQPVCQQERKSSISSKFSTLDFRACAFLPKFENPGKT